MLLGLFPGRSRTVVFVTKKRCLVVFRGMSVVPGVDVGPVVLSHLANLLLCLLVQFVLLAVIPSFPASFSS